jgi:hypothetical protein
VTFIHVITDICTIEIALVMGHGDDGLAGTAKRRQNFMVEPLTGSGVLIGRPLV